MRQYDSWAEVMAELELSVETASNTDGATDAAAHVAWTPPTHLGPLPLHLRDQAERLLLDQRESIRNLEEMHRETGRHLAAVRSVPRQADGQSVYLDVSG
ncbi:hypothetical protein ABIE21_003529 [Conyzicola nivalis]|uniref:Uncharacterized protein n=1 Tax=Conyzicola nivalis TaxID=1477021 RepID=A0ABV2QT22_9MICO